MSQTQHTTGSATRPGHSVGGEHLRYSLEQEQRELQSQIGRTTAGRTAKTLAKTDTLRVTLVQLRSGTTVHPTATAGAASLQVLNGRLQVEGVPDAVGAGEVLIFSHNLREPLRALEDSTFLITVAWEEGAGAWDQEEQSTQH